MTRHEKRKYYNLLTEEYKNISNEIGIRLDYQMITFVNTNMCILLSKDKKRLYTQSKLSALKNGFLRSFKKINDNNELTNLDKIRIYKKMVNTYYEKCMTIKKQIDNIYKTERKDGLEYTYKQKLEDVRKVKHYVKKNK